MTITLLAPDGVAVTAQQERQARAAMYGGNPARPLGGRSGFRPGTTSDTLTATSTTWTLKPCSLMIDPGATTAQGMYGWASDANITGNVTAADATNPRLDIVYLQISDSTSGDGSGAVSYAPQYLAGTPVVTPSAPALPPRSFLLGTISVPKSGGGSPTATLNPQYFVAAGGILPVSSQAERDALTAFAGRSVARLDLPGVPIQTYDGAAWQGPGAITPTPLTINSGWVVRGSGFAAPAVYRSAGRVYLCGAVTNTSATTSLTALIPYIPCQLPGGFAPTKGARFPVQFQPTQQSGSSVNGYVQVDSTGKVTMALSSTVSGAAAGDFTLDLNSVSWLDA